MSDPTTWSVLVGVALGGAISYLTVQLQLRHAASEARVARSHALKSEVYLEAAEGVAEWTKFLQSIPRVDLTMQQVSQIESAHPGSGYKVHVVGDLDTIKAFDQAGECVVSRGLDLMVKRADLDTLRSAAAAVRERMTQLGTQAEQLVAVLQAVSVPDATPEARGLTPEVTRHLLAAHAEFAKVAAEHYQASGREALAHRELVVASMKAIVELQRYLSQAVVHVRRELGLPFDAKDYLAHVERTSDGALAELQKMMDRLDS